VFLYLSYICRTCSQVYTCPLTPSTGNLVLGKTCKTFMTFKSCTSFLIQEEWAIKFAYGVQNLEPESHIWHSQILAVQFFHPPPIWLYLQHFFLLSNSILIGSQLLSGIQWVNYKLYWHSTFFQIYLVIKMHRELFTIQYKKILPLRTENFASRRTYLKKIKWTKPDCVYMPTYHTLSFREIQHQWSYFYLFVSKYLFTILINTWKHMLKIYYSEGIFKYTFIFYKHTNFLLKIQWKHVQYCCGWDVV
jgi:hypothetical protein